ncbi:hypothetical protein V1478_017842 [Vespula squamosa]|uniref:Uncharacterized protein n=1 Tax=Vespula squamosa TaxID=30214 RepID=A0ABD1ZVC2_VESSQ
MTNYEINVAISHVISWKLVTGSIVYNCFIPKLSSSKQSSQILKAASWNSAKDFNGFNQITMRKRAGEPIAIKPNGDYSMILPGNAIDGHLQGTNIASIVPNRVCLRWMNRMDVAYGIRSRGIVYKRAQDKTDRRLCKALFDRARRINYRYDRSLFKTYEHAVDFHCVLVSSTYVQVEALANCTYSTMNPTFQSSYLMSQEKSFSLLTSSHVSSATSSWRSFARGVGALLKGQLALCILQAGAAAA